MSTDKSGAGYWSTGLFDCCNNGTAGLCVLACLCPPCGFATNAEKLNKHEVTCGESYCGACSWMSCLWLLTWMGCPFCQCLANTSTRAYIRQKYSIGGNMYNDMLVAAICTPCAIAQESYELKKQGC